MISFGILVPSRDSPLHPLTALFGEVQTLSEKLKAAGGVHDNKHISAPESSILRLLDGHGALTVPHVARLCHTSRQNIQMWVNRLRTEGYVEFLPNPSHKRSDLARLTASGRIISASMTKQQTELLERLSSSVSQTEVLGAAAVLRRVEQSFTAEPRLPEDPAKHAEKSAQKIRKSASRTKTVPAKPKRQSAEPLVSAPQARPPVDDDEFPLNLL